MPLFDFGYRNSSWSEWSSWTSSQAALGLWDWEQPRHSRKKTFQPVTGLKQVCFTTTFQGKSTKSPVFLITLSYVWTAIILDTSHNMNNDGFITSYFLSCSGLWLSYKKIQLHVPYIIFQGKSFFNLFTLQIFHNRNLYFRALKGESDLHHWWLHTNCLPETLPRAAKFTWQATSHHLRNCHLSSSTF